MIKVQYCDSKSNEHLQPGIFFPSDRCENSFQWFFLCWMNQYWYTVTFFFAQIAAVSLHINTNPEEYLIRFSVNKSEHKQHINISGPSREQTGAKESQTWRERCIMCQEWHKTNKFLDFWASKCHYWPLSLNIMKWLMQNGTVLINRHRRARQDWCLFRSMY